MSIQTDTITIYLDKNVSANNSCANSNNVLFNFPKINCAHFLKFPFVNVIHSLWAAVNDDVALGSPREEKVTLSPRVCVCVCLYVCVCVNLLKSICSTDLKQRSEQNRNSITQVGWP